MVAMVVSTQLYHLGGKSSVAAGESKPEICTHNADQAVRMLQVYKAMKDGVSPVAVKVFPSNATDVQLEEFQREVVILKSCRDRNIVQFLGACIEDGQTFLVTGAAPQGIALFVRPLR